MSEAVAIAHPNLALSKYWGKLEGSFLPAVPSLSVTLSGLSTRTSVRFDESLAQDEILLDGQAVGDDARERVVRLLNRVRRASGQHRYARVASTNDFPTASGLASSASGFAALAAAATRAAALNWDQALVSDLARGGSVSAARSIFGGYVELEVGDRRVQDGEMLAARPVVAGDHLPLVVLVCVVTEGRKTVSSRTGMQMTLQRSPYAGAWLAEAPRLHARLRDALLARDFRTVGELSEQSALSMHAAAMAAGVIYWTGATLEILSTVRALRASGIAAYASVDAGPHVKVLVAPAEVASARPALQELPGVRRVIEARPGEGARIIDAREGAS
jgi:diphosphomevalonate decarboxylase